MTSIRSSIVATADPRGAFPRTSLMSPPSPAAQESGRSFSAGEPLTAGCSGLAQNQAVGGGGD